MPKLNILLVDDRQENLLTLESVLTDPNFNLVRASSGEQALLKSLKNDFALILLDVHMPVMDGFETADILRSRERTADVPIIFITAVYHEISYVLRAYKLGAVDYVTKPFEPEVLRAKVAVFTELYQRTQNLIEERELRQRMDLARLSYLDVLNRLDRSIVWEASVSDRHLLFVSQQAEKILGYPHHFWFEDPDFYLGHVYPEDRPFVESLFKKALEFGCDARGEHRMVTADGRSLWFHTGIQIEQIKVEGDAPKLKYRGLSVEITELKYSEERVRRSEAKYRHVVEANMLGYVFSDRLGIITDANHYFVNLIGRDLDRSLIQSLGWKDIIPAEFWAIHDQAIREVKSKGISAPFEVKIVGRNGNLIPVMIGATLLEDSKDEYVAFVLDLTEQKRIESERLYAVKQREEMLSVVSHDLKAPLSAILLYTSLMIRKDLSQLNPTEIKRMALAMERGAQRMKRLIEDLLDVAQIGGVG